MTTDDKDILERKAILEFPCQFPIKIMGRDHAVFRDAAREIVEKHAGKISDDAVHQAASRKGNFVSITITIEASSQLQLDSIYQDLTAHDEILVAL
jgi:putative lipoic acid-binding regulatory protein